MAAAGDSVSRLGPGTGSDPAELCGRLGGGMATPSVTAGAAVARLRLPPITGDSTSSHRGLSKFANSTSRSSRPASCPSAASRLELTLPASVNKNDNNHHWYINPAAAGPPRHPPAAGGHKVAPLYFCDDIVATRRDREAKLRKHTSS